MSDDVEKVVKQPIQDPVQTAINPQAKFIELQAKGAKKAGESAVGIDKLKRRRRRARREERERREALQAQQTRERKEAIEEQSEQSRKVRAARRVSRRGGARRQLLFSSNAGSTSTSRTSSSGNLAGT